MRVPKSRGRGPWAIASFIAIPLFFTSLMSATLALEKQKETHEKLVESAKQIADDILTPWEQLGKKIEEIVPAESNGTGDDEPAA